MKPLHNYLKTNIHKRNLKNDMISNQQIITGFFFHTLKPLQYDLNSNVNTSVLQIQETIQYKQDFRSTNFSLFFSLWSHCIMTSIPISAQETYILNVKQQRKLYVWLTKKTSTAPRKNFKLNLLRRTNMLQIWKVKLNQLCHYFCEVKIWIYINVTQIVSQSLLLCVLPHQHWYWFTDKSKCAHVTT